MILSLLYLIHSTGQGTLSKERSWRPGRIFPLQGVWKELQQRPVVERSRQSSPKKAPVRPVQRGHAYTINTEDSHQICSSERKAGIVFHVQVQRKDRSRYSESHEDSRKESIQSDLSTRLWIFKNVKKSSGGALCEGTWTKERKVWLSPVRLRIFTGNTCDQASSESSRRCQSWPHKKSIQERSQRYILYDQVR